MEENKKIPEMHQQANQSGKFTLPTTPQVSHISPRAPFGLQITPGLASSFQLSRLPILLIFLGSIETLVSILFLLLFASHFFSAYKNLDTIPLGLYLTSLLHLTAILFPIIQITFGTFFYVRQKNYVPLQQSAKTLEIILLFLTLLATLYMLIILASGLDPEKGKVNAETQVNEIINPLATPTPIQ